MTDQPQAMSDKQQAHKNPEQWARELQGKCPHSATGRRAQHECTICLAIALQGFADQEMKEQTEVLKAIGMLSLRRFRERQSILEPHTDPEVKKGDDGTFAERPPIPANEEMATAFLCYSCGNRMYHESMGSIHCLNLKCKGYAEHRWIADLRLQQLEDESLLAAYDKSQTRLKELDCMWDEPAYRAIARGVESCLLDRVCFLCKVQTERKERGAINREIQELADRL